MYRAGGRDARVGDVGHRLVRARRRRALRRHRGVAAGSARRATHAARRRSSCPTAATASSRSIGSRASGRSPPAASSSTASLRYHAFADRAARRAARHASRSRRRRDVRARRAPSCAAFDRVAPRRSSRASFLGTLREYQREGLGWLHFLRTFGLGGCLADDMGLGKTVQVLALLDARRGDAGQAGASVDRRRPAVARVQLDARGASASRRTSACSTTPAPGGSIETHRRRRRRPRDHDLRHAAARHARELADDPRSTTRFSTRRRRSRHAGSASAKAARLLARRPSARDDRHADREPHRGALEPIRVLESRNARRRRRRFARSRDSPARATRPADATCSPARCGR